MKKIQTWLMLALWFSVFLLSSCSPSAAEKKTNNSNKIIEQSIVDSLTVDVSNIADTTLLTESLKSITISVSSINLDTIALISKLKEDISKLLATKDSNFINDTIFGDCLYSYLCSNDTLSYKRSNASDPVLKKDIIINFDKILIFEEIREGLKQQTINDIYFYVNDGRVSDFPFIYQHKNQKIIHTFISFNEMPGEFSKLYWFAYIDKKWKFCGLTCVG